MSRPNAMLTTNDREFLRGKLDYDGDYASQQRYERRENITTRVEHSLRDFGVLIDSHSRQERQELLDRIDLDQQALGACVSFAIGFLYLLINDTDDFRFLAERGIRTALANEDYLFSEINLDLEVVRDPPEVDGFISRMGSDEEITAQEISRFFSHRGLSDFTPNQLRKLEKSDNELIRKHAESIRDLKRFRREHGLE